MLCCYVSMRVVRYSMTRSVLCFWPKIHPLKILTPLHNRKTFVWLHDLCLEILNVHGNEMRLLRAMTLLRSFPHLLPHHLHFSPQPSLISHPKIFPSLPITLPSSPFISPSLPYPFPSSSHFPWPSLSSPFFPHIPPDHLFFPPPHHSLTCKGWQHITQTKQCRW